MTVMRQVLNVLVLAVLLAATGYALVYVWTWVTP